MLENKRTVQHTATIRVVEQYSFARFEKERKMPRSTFYATNYELGLQGLGGQTDNGANLRGQGCGVRFQEWGLWICGHVLCISVNVQHIFTSAGFRTLFSTCSQTEKTVVFELHHACVAGNARANWYSCMIPLRCTSFVSGVFLMQTSFADMFDSHRFHPTAGCADQSSNLCKERSSCHFHHLHSYRKVFSTQTATNCRIFHPVRINCCVAAKLFRLFSYNA